jgi:hypothetical protein
VLALVGEVLRLIPLEPDSRHSNSVSTNLPLCNPWQAKETDDDLAGHCPKLSVEMGAGVDGVIAGMIEPCGVEEPRLPFRVPGCAISRGWRRSSSLAGRRSAG